MKRYTARKLRMLVAKSSVGQHHAPLALRGANLDELDLSHVDLHGADLRGASLRGAVLVGADLRDARLGSARFDGACLDRADLTRADLVCADLRGCSTTGTLMLEANLDEVVLPFPNGVDTTGGRNMVTVTFARMRERPGWQVSREAVLSQEDLRALLRWSARKPRPLNLRGCNLPEADLVGANLAGACLCHADLTGAQLRGANLEGACLDHAILTGADLRDVRLERARSL